MGSEAAVFAHLHRGDHLGVNGEVQKNGVNGNKKRGLVLL